MQTLPQTYRWSRSEYERLGELGFFTGRRVELIGGQIVEMSPKKPRHSAGNERAKRALESVFPPDRFWIRAQEPLALGQYDEPEPDVAVVPGGPEDYSDDHPSGALLIVEVADTTLAYDRGAKADIYAAAGIDDYWVINLVARVVEVCRRPLPDLASETGHRYAERLTVAAGGRIAPLAASDHPILVDDLLP
jgi:Uma2 family endonuclease